MTQFADCATSIVTPIIENVGIAKDTMRIRVNAPEMASRVVPGQFFMLRNPAANDPLIGRAFAIYDVGPDRDWIDLVYVVKGKLTRSVAVLRPGNAVALWGPLGNGFAPTPSKHLIMVAGGIGQTPFLALAKEALGKCAFGEATGLRASGYAERVSFCYGVRSKDYLAGVEQFGEVGCAMHIATEDGTVGSPRRVTDVLGALLNEARPSETRIVCCGPEPMMEAVAGLAHSRSFECEVSLETPMACGIGICFTCVAKIGSADDWDYKRTCVEGPVFDSKDVLWH